MLILIGRNGQIVVFYSCAHLFNPLKALYMRRINKKEELEFREQ